MIRKILVPIDGSVHAGKAIEFAAHMARQNGASVHLLHIIQPAKIPAALLD
ncbi:MAG: universal stress protein [Desulfobacterales bacterium]|nr:MAG: universal stress protein [Desulfobacterales bacterium]